MPPEKEKETAILLGAIHPKIHFHAAPQCSGGSHSPSCPAGAHMLGCWEVKLPIIGTHYLCAHL